MGDGPRGPNVLTYNWGPLLGQNVLIVFFQNPNRSLLTEEAISHEQLGLSAPPGPLPLLPRGGAGVSAPRTGDPICFGFRGCRGRADGAGKASAASRAAGAACDGLEGGGAGPADPRASAQAEEAS